MTLCCVEDVYGGGPGRAVRRFHDHLLLSQFDSNTSSEAHPDRWGRSILGEQGGAWVHRVEAR